MKPQQAQDENSRAAQRWTEAARSAQGLGPSLARIAASRETVEPRYWAQIASQAPEQTLLGKNQSFG